MIPGIRSGSAALGLLLLASGLASGATVEGGFTFDTRAFAGREAILDFLLLPAVAGEPELTVEIVGFTLPGGLGTLPSPLVIENTGAFNNVQRAVMLGESIGFRWLVTSPALDPGPPLLLRTTFSFSILESDGIAFLAPSTGPALIIDLETDRTLTITSAAVPEPAAGWLMLGGLAGLGAIGRRRG